MEFMRKEYPRPQFQREIWQSLNGVWEFCFDDGENLSAEKICRAKNSLENRICVPFAYQCKASGIGSEELHERMWYRRSFMLDKSMKGGRVLLHFNAVDYRADVWLNGNYVGGHDGGYTHFSFDVTKYLSKEKENVIVVRVIDRFDTAQPRGKQYWKREPSRCWYVASSGIWQSVWLERTGCGHIEYALITPDIDTNSISVETLCEGNFDGILARISYRGREVGAYQFTATERHSRFQIVLAEEDSVDEVHFWSPESPNLYDVTFELLNKEKVADRVKSYFAFRKVSVLGNKVLLNNAPIYQKLVLDQGYWADTDLTPPCAQSLKEDILAAKAMGFNGARKHQKVEDAYFYYYADHLGFLVWGEMPSAYCYCMQEVEMHSAQYLELIRQLYNHPSIIVWVPLNESWGVRKLLIDDQQKSYARAMYYFTKSIDSTRLISTNDGWENLTETDFLSIHDYAPEGAGWAEKYARENLEMLYPMRRRLMGMGERIAGIKPVLMTEYGGIAMQTNDVKQLHHEEDGESWGYAVDDTPEKALARYENLNRGIFACSFAGFCYTQLTDVKQEVNGLLDAYHRPKYNSEKIARINDEGNYRK